MVSTSIQDRTNEFRTILSQAQRRQNSTKTGAQRASLLSDPQKAEANGSAAGGQKGTRSEFARNAAQIGRGITATMGKLERLGQRKRLHPALLNILLTSAQSPGKKPYSTTDQSRYPN